MAKIDLGHSGKYRDTVVTMMCLYQSATIILRELARERGDGPWFEALREEIRATIKDAVPAETKSGDEAAAVLAGMTAVDAVFDCIASSEQIPIPQYK